METKLMEFSNRYETHNKSWKYTTQLQDLNLGFSNSSK